MQEHDATPDPALNVVEDAPGSRLMAADVSLRTDTLEIGKIQTLFEARRVHSYDVSTDGQKFIVEEVGRVGESGR